MLRFPPLALVVLACIRMGFQQLLPSPLQRWSYPGRAPWHGSLQDVSCLALLFYVALDGRPRHLEAFDELGVGFPFVNGAKDLLSQML
jgi:hypothetical protein